MKREMAFKCPDCKQVIPVGNVFVCGVGTADAKLQLAREIAIAIHKKMKKCKTALNKSV